MKSILTAVILFSFGFGARPILAQTPFFADKTVNVVLGGPPAGSADMRTRAVVNILRKHVPGNPTIVVQHRVDVRRAERLADDPLDQVALLVGGVADHRRDPAARAAQALCRPSIASRPARPRRSPAQPRRRHPLLGARTSRTRSGPCRRASRRRRRGCRGRSTRFTCSSRTVKLTLHWLGQSVQTEPACSMSQGRARKR